MKPHIIVFFLPFVSLLAWLAACSNQHAPDQPAQAENLYAEAISTSYTIALPDSKGEGVRMTYTFFNMKRADTGNFKMTHVYMRHTGQEDTIIVNGTWKLSDTDSGRYIRTWSGRIEREFRYTSEWTLLTVNTDSVIADAGLLLFRQKTNNDMLNSTVRVSGKVLFGAENNAVFLDVSGDTIPILKMSAFRELLALNDSVNLNSAAVKSVELIGTFQIRMAMDGRKTQRSLIVEKVVGIKGN